MEAQWGLGKLGILNRFFFLGGGVDSDPKLQSVFGGHM